MRDAWPGIRPRRHAIGGGFSRRRYFFKIRQKLGAIGVKRRGGWDVILYKKNFPPLESPDGPPNRRGLSFVPRLVQARQWRRTAAIQTAVSPEQSRGPSAPSAAGGRAMLKSQGSGPSVTLRAWRCSARVVASTCQGATAAWGSPIIRSSAGLGRGSSYAPSTP